MIVHWPGKIPAGQVGDFAWAAWDFLPTAASITLTQSPANIDGLSVMPTLLAQTQTNRHEFFHWVLRGRESRRLRAWVIGNRAPKADAPWELYDLKTDPGKRKTLRIKIPRHFAI